MSDQFKAQNVAQEASSNVSSGFAESEDGVQLHWRIVGHGPLMICCNGVGVSTFFWKYD